MVVGEDPPTSLGVIVAVVGGGREDGGEGAGVTMVISIGIAVVRLLILYY